MNATDPYDLAHDLLSALEGETVELLECPDCGAVETPESAEYDGERERYLCINWDDHPLCEGREDWPTVVKRTALLLPVDGGFKYAGHSGPHPSLVADCPTCGSPAGHYCNENGRPVDGPHPARRERAKSSQPDGGLPVDGEGPG